MPFLSEFCYRSARKTIDVLAVFATVAGVVTSLGLGVMQINAGLNYLFGIPTTLVIQIIIIAVLLREAAVGNIAQWGKP